MFVHLCFADELGLLDGLVADGVADAECVVPVVAAELVEALAMVRPRPRLAPRTPAPMAVPISGRVILTMFSNRSAGSGAGWSRIGPGGP